MKSMLLQDGPEKTFAVVFDDGEKAVSSLLQFASDYKITAAYLSAIGSFHRVTLGCFDGSAKQYQPIAVHEPVELLSFTGNIARNDAEEPKLHATVVVGRSD